ncbi:hypothetical protein D3C75_1046840 [compost metagenome]
MHDILDKNHYFSECYCVSLNGGYNWISPFLWERNRLHIMLCQKIPGAFIDRMKGQEKHFLHKMLGLKSVNSQHF